MNKKIAVAIALVVAVAAGAVGGYLYRRHTKPTLEEKVEDASKDLQKAWDKVTR